MKTVLRSRSLQACDGDLHALVLYPMAAYKVRAAAAGGWPAWKSEMHFSMVHSYTLKNDSESYCVVHNSKQQQKYVSFSLIISTVHVAVHCLYCSMFQLSSA